MYQNVTCNIGYLDLIFLLLRKAVALSSASVSFITVGGAAGELTLEPIDCRESLSLLVIWPLSRSLMWCFTIISSNVFRGEYCICNIRQVRYSPFNGIHLHSSQPPKRLQDVPYSFYRVPQCWESASSVICCWYWPLCADAPHPYRQLSSWDPAQQCFAP